MSTDEKTTVEKALAALGNTAHEVADSLRSKGITGKRTVAEYCPISNFVRHALNRNVYTRTGPRYTFWAEVAPTSTDDFSTALLPEAVEKFVRRFDTGEYPDLEDPR